MTWHFQSADDDFAEVQAGDLQAHLVKVSGHAPVEVSLDMKRVEVRPYGVSKGAAIAAILERLNSECERDNGMPASPNASPTAASAPAAGSAAELPLAFSTALELSRTGAPTASMDREEEGSAPTGPRSILTSSRSSAPDGEAATPRDGQDAGGVLLAPPGPQPFRWVLCASEVISRDEDLFSNLLALGEEDDAKVFTCCVGKTLSQADYHLSDSNEVAGLLDLLAHASYDQRADSSLSGSFVASTEGSDLPSTLERLHQLVKVLAGKQLLLLFDYEICSATSFQPTREMARLLRLYPAAVVQRNPTPPQDAAALAEAASSLHGSAVSDAVSLGAISGVQIVSYGRPAGMGGQAAASAPNPGRSVHQVIDSYRPALEACLAVLQAKFSSMQPVAIEDNTFSLTVTHRGASEEEAAAVRSAVATLVGEEYPMLRSIEERMEVHIRPEAGWNRARMVEWIVTQVVEAVESQLGHRGVMPIYVGEDPAFRHISAIGGLDILLTGGPATDSYFLRSAMQVDELLRWFAEQHAAGVTVRGGKLRPSKQQSQQPGVPGFSGPRGNGAGADGRERSGKRVQIFQPDLFPARDQQGKPSSNGQP